MTPNKRYVRIQNCYLVNLSQQVPSHILSVRIGHIASALQALKEKDNSMFLRLVIWQAVDFS